MKQQNVLVQQKPRSQWTNLDWANHLQCPIQEVLDLRKHIAANYQPVICKHVITGKYHFCVLQRHIAPSGWEDWHLWLSDDVHGFTDSHAAARYANDVIIPELQFNSVYAKLAGVPVRALQLMRVSER